MNSLTHRDPHTNSLTHTEPCTHKPPYKQPHIQTASHTLGHKHTYSLCSAHISLPHSSHSHSPIPAQTITHTCTENCVHHHHQHVQPASTDTLSYSTHRDIHTSVFMCTHIPSPGTFSHLLTTAVCMHSVISSRAISCFNL